MRYARTVIFQAAHFNETAYSKYEQVNALVEQGRAPERQQLLSLLKDCHGHNFKAEIVLETTSSLDDYSGYIIADETLVQLVMEWDGLNLSVHPDFLEQKIRATTENMAKVLHAKIQKAVNVSANITVTIRETADISATHSSLHLILG